jgi:hypothetical protein
VDESRELVSIDPDLITINSLTVNGITIELMKEKEECPLGIPYILRTTPRIMTGEDPCWFGQYWKAQIHFKRMVNRVSPMIERN